MYDRNLKYKNKLTQKLIISRISSAKRRCGCIIISYLTEIKPFNKNPSPSHNG